MATMTAEPYEFEFDPRSTALIVIDMQRDFVEPGGFGEALGNDVTPLQKVIEPCRRVARTGPFSPGLWSAAIAAFWDSSNSAAASDPASRTRSANCVMTASSPATFLFPQGGTLRSSLRPLCSRSEVSSSGVPTSAQRRSPRAVI